MTTPNVRRAAARLVVRDHDISQRPLPGSGLLANHERGPAGLSVSTPRPSGVIGRRTTQKFAKR